MAKRRPSRASSAIGSQWVAVSSSNVEAVKYEDGTLYVKFLAKGNSPSATYAYFNVPEEVAVAMVNAPSKGQFVWQELRDVYEYSRIS